MVKLRKNARLYILNILGMYPRVKRFIVSFPLEKKLFNAISVTYAQYFIYLKLCLGWYNDIQKLEIVNLAVNGPIL